MRLSIHQEKALLYVARRMFFRFIKAATFNRLYTEQLIKRSPVPGRWELTNEGELIARNLLTKKGVLPCPARSGRR